MKTFVINILMKTIYFMAQNSDTPGLNLNVYDFGFPVWLLYCVLSVC